MLETPAFKVNFYSYRNGTSYEQEMLRWFGEQAHLSGVNLVMTSN